MKKNELLVSYGSDYQALTVELLEEAGLSDLIGDRNRRIGIKPNLVAAVPASDGGTTHPEVVDALIGYLKGNGFKNLFVLEGSWVGDLTEDAYRECGYEELCERHQVPFIDMQKEPGEVLKESELKLKVGRFVRTLDYLIDVPVLKGHCQTRITCAMKNLKGLLPNSEKRRFHRLGLHEPIAQLARAIMPDFILVDSICGDLCFEDGGNPVQQNRLLVGRDAVLMDSYCCGFLGIDPSEIEYIVRGAELGAGSMEIAHAVVRELHGENKVHVSFDPKKVLRLSELTEEVESCSACYGYLIPALAMLEEEGLLHELKEKISIGQGYRGKEGILGVGNCTCHFRHSCKGCPPTENQIYAFLKDYILENRK